VSDVRLFVAVELPADVRHELGRWAQAAVGDDPALRLAREDALHVTLAFLGHRPSEEIDALALAVRESAAAVPVGGVPLALGEAAWFDPRRPRVLTALLQDPSAALAALHEPLWSRLEALGHERERRRFRPHVTVARVRHGAKPRHLDVPNVPQRSFAAVGLTLFRSRLGGGPARYEALESVALGEGSPQG
jgi:RNA 2',3'-cyclic 3'-phosphodiesterase